MNTNKIQPILREQNLSIRVAQNIENMIRANELKVGEKIPSERLLSERFQVSRTVIREATRFLMAKGLLNSQAGDGTYVRNIDSGDVSDYLSLHISMQSNPTSIENFMEIRRTLEIQIAKFAAERATEANIQELSNNLKEMKRLEDSPEEFAQKDLEFHLSMARATQNPLFEILLNPLMDSILEIIHKALGYEKAVKEATYFHQSILQKLIARDVNGAGEEMAAHLVQSRNAVIFANNKEM